MGSDKPEPLGKVDSQQVTQLPTSYIVSGVLLASFVSNQWCRQAIYYLCDFSASSTAFQHINVALQFNKESYATLSSFGFTLVFAVIVGASQAFFNPAAYTLIADTYPARLVGRMNGILSSGIYLGGGLASLSVLLDSQVGWRGTMVAIGAIGAASAAVTSALVKEPRTQKKGESAAINVLPPAPSAAQGAGPAAIAEALKDVLSPYLSQLLLSASVLRFCAGFAIVVWKAPFVFAKFPHSEFAFAGGNAVIVALGGVVSSLLGGYLSDTLANPADKTRKPISRCWVAAVGSLLAAPCWAGFLLASTPEQAAVFLLLEYLTAECWFGPTLAALYTVVPARRRGVAQGVFSVLTAVGTLGPIAVGSFSNLNVFTSPQLPLAQELSRLLQGGAGTSAPLDGAINVGAVGTVLLGVVCGAYLLSAVLFAAAAAEEDKKNR